MKIVELSNSQFDEYSKLHPLSNYCQTSKYALVMTEYGYNYDYIGLIDDQERIQAAALIITKKIKGNIKYGYSPKGFLVNYYNPSLIKEFFKLLTNHYKKKDFVFIKFNPEIIIGETDRRHKYSFSYNGNVRIIDELKALNVKRRLELKEFDLMMPKYNAYINLKEFDIKNIYRGYRKKIKKAIDKGMYLTIGDVKEIDILYGFCKNKSPRSLSYYRTLYNTFNKDNSIDLIYIKLDFQKYLNYIRKVYDNEQNNNYMWNESLQSNPGEHKYVKKKMESDRILEDYKKQIIYATQQLKKHHEVYVAGALVIKHRNRVIITASGYSEEFKKENPNQFLYYAIVERYKPYFNYCDIGGVSGKFDDTSKYKGLNEFKAKFDSKIYEYIGEFDLICNEKIFKKLIKTSYIEDEFSKEKD